MDKGLAPGLGEARGARPSYRLGHPGRLHRAPTASSHTTVGLPRQPDGSIVAQSPYPSNSTRGCPVVTAIGEIDGLTVPWLESALARVLRQDRLTIVVGLSAVIFLGSSGLAVLDRYIRACAQPLHVVACSPPVLRPIAVTGMADAPRRGPGCTGARGTRARSGRTRRAHDTALTAERLVAVLDCTPDNGGRSWSTSWVPPSQARDCGCAK
ncbi:STAS domain-containing protein [Nocardia sp. NPDC055321]